MKNKTYLYLYNLYLYKNYIFAFILICIYIGLYFLTPVNLGTLPIQQDVDYSYIKLTDEELEQLTRVFDKKL